MTFLRKLRRAGLKLIVVGIVLGLAIGLGIKAIEGVVASAIHDLLNDEAIKACDCSFAADSIKINLLGLNGIMLRPRLESNGVAKLEFEHATATFSLNEIATKQIVLNDLHLVSGVAHNVDEDSVTFKFIDNLTTSTEPATSNANRWRLKLTGLRVSSSEFIQNYPGTAITGQGISLRLSRDAKDDFILKPFIQDLAIQIKPQNPDSTGRVISLGKVSSVIELTDTQAFFKRLRLRKQKNRVLANATSQSKAGNLLTGTTEYRLTTELLQLGDFLSGEVIGQGNLSGSLGQPAMSGTLALEPGKDLVFNLIDIPLLTLNSLAGEFDYALKKGIHHLSVNKLSSSAPGIFINQVQPLTLVDDAINGSLNIAAASINFMNIEFKDVDLAVQLGQSLNDPLVKVSGTSGSAQLAGLATPKLEFTYNGLSPHKISIQHSSKQYGKFEWHGHFETDENGNLSQDNLIKLQDFIISIPTNSPEGEVETSLQHFKFSGTAGFSDITSLGGLTGQGELQLQSTYFPDEASIATRFTIENGILLGSLENSTKTIKLTSNIDLVDQHNRNTLSLSLKNFKPSEHSPASHCIEASGQLDYNFELENYKTGSGSFNLSDLQLGCQPYTATLAKAPFAMPITNGQININDLKISGLATNLEIKGQVGSEGYNLVSLGKLELNALVGFFPMLDDLKGNLTTNLRVNGLLNFPEVHGSATISDTELASESLDIFARAINGELNLQGPIINIVKLDGLLNNGSASVSGELNVFSIDQSSLDLSFTEIPVDTISDTAILLSGELSLRKSINNIPLISGSINLDSVEILKEIKAVDIVKSLFKSLLPFGRTDRPSIQDDGSTTLELDLKITAARDVLLISNFLTAEFSTDLNIRGTLENPIIVGNLTVLSGWLGIKSRRFDITSGTIKFSETSNVPEIDVIAEISVFSKTGNFIPIILQASGLITNPRIELSSETGYSQQELLALLTSGIRDQDSTRLNRFQGIAASESFSLFEDRERAPFYQLLHRLTTIDDIGIEPALNTRTGSVEPLLSVTKYLTSRLALVGESFLGAEGYSRAKARVDLSDSLSLVGLIDSNTTKRNSAIGVDLIYTILAKRLPFVEFEINTIKGFSKAKLLSNIRLNPDSRIRPTELEALKNSLLQTYYDEGYKAAQAIVTCEELAGFCRSLKMQINEGPQDLVKRRIISGDPLPPEVPQNSLRKFSKNSPATRKLLQSEVEYLTNRLRSEGYLSARVNASYQPLSDLQSNNLVLELTLGNQQSFIFEGNTVFSASDFLETINLFKRKQPFGRNTVNILIENMERMYQEAGYLYATFEHERTVDDNLSRTFHRIIIKEEQKTLIEQVEFTGNLLINTTLLEKKLSDLSQSTYKEVMRPSALVAEKIQININSLLSLYEEAGFSGTSISYETMPGEKPNGLILRYIINEGQRRQFKNINITNWPSEIEYPQSLYTPFSISALNEYILNINQILNEEGYLNIAVLSEINPDTSQVIINVAHDEPVRISSVLVQGLLHVSEDLVIRTARISKGSIWSKTALNKARARLLGLGLFSRIELLPADGSLDDAEETLLIRLNERPLTTLEVGAGVNSELGLHVFGEASDKSLLKDGRSLSLRVDSYFDQVRSEISQGIASLRYAVPQVLGSNLRFTQDLRFQKLDLDTLEFDLERRVADSSLHYSPNDSTVATLNYLLFMDDISNVAQDAQLSSFDEGQVTLASLGASVRWDWRDNPVLPNQGYTLAFDPSITNEYLGSEADYYSVGGRFSGLHPFSLGRFAFAHNTRVASAWTYNGSDQIPITQRYYLGGRQTIRGFRENSLGPRGDEGSILGGDSLLQNNFELRYNFEEAFSTHIFLDIGNVFLRDQSLSTSDFRESAGVGFRYLSPIGPIGFDLGHPLDEREAEPSVRLHFTIGTMF